MLLKYEFKKRLPEANIQAEIYSRLRAIDIQCCLEYKIWINSLQASSRADIVIIRDGYIIAIIEVKSRKVGSKPNKNGRQYQKYEAIGIPFIYCMCSEDIDSVISWVRWKYNNIT